jgi:hypothetical protein
VLWFHKHYRSIYSFDGTTWTLHNSSNSTIQYGDVGYMNINADGHIHIPSSDSVAIYDGASWRSLTVSDGMNEGNKSVVFIDDQDNIWV